MGTNFTEIYELNEVLKSDNRLNSRPTNLIYELYFTYLKYGIGLFKYDSFIDLTARTDFSMKEYSYIANGSDTVFLLDPPPISDSMFYVGYRINSDVAYTEIYDTGYVFDEENNTITTNIVIPNNYSVYIASYEIGSFTNTLTESEINILAEAMLIPWSQEKLMKNSLLDHLVYGGSSKTSGTQANHIKEVKDVKNNQHYKVVEGMINRYSFKAAPNSLNALGGGLI